MLATPIETICFIILKARQFDAEAPTGVEDAGSADDLNVGLLEDEMDEEGDTTIEELTSAIELLGPEQQAELVALTWVGRGDFDRSSWRGALKTATDAWTTHTASYLTGNPQLGDLLEEGLSTLGYSCSEIEA